MKSLSPLLRTLLILNLVAGLIVLAGIFWPLPGQASRPITRNFQDLDTHKNTASAVDVSEVLDRPLFHENRRKPVAAVAKAQKAAPVRQLEQPYVLAGIMGSGDGGRTVYLMNKHTQETVSAKEGDNAGQWQVKKIDQTSVTLQSGNTVRILDMTSRN
ncbi:hypothetical protein [Kordiimonas marina]|uniref:hypothetical protein n=1 Tax=Kordiimonas marina TaxID=2872312 RepID=UPI001FF60DB0|nr:hypothetical protein [Kordiimonas marina]MCJ9430034.1 hypothetical protein [Kordiimonas marina]